MTYIKTIEEVTENTQVSDVVGNINKADIQANTRDKLHQAMRSPTETKGEIAGKTSIKPILDQNDAANQLKKFYQEILQQPEKFTVESIRADIHDRIIPLIGKSAEHHDFSDQMNEARKKFAPAPTPKAPEAISAPTPVVDFAKYRSVMDPTNSRNKIGMYLEYMAYRLSQWAEKMSNDPGSWMGKMLNKWGLAEKAKLFNAVMGMHFAPPAIAPPAPSTVTPPPSSNPPKQKQKEDKNVPPAALKDIFDDEKMKNVNLLDVDSATNPLQFSQDDKLTISKGHEFITLNGQRYALQLKNIQTNGLGDIAQYFVGFLQRIDITGAAVQPLLKGRNATMYINANKEFVCAIKIGSKFEVVISQQEMARMLQKVRDDRAQNPNATIKVPVNCIIRENGALIKDKEGKDIPNDTLEIGLKPL